MNLRCLNQRELGYLQIFDVEQANRDNTYIPECSMLCLSKAKLGIQDYQAVMNIAISILD